MKVILIFLASVVPFTFCLIGGKEVDRSHHFVVSIQDNNKEHICGGTIYANRFILTASTCVTGKNPNEISILAGTVGLEEQPEDGIRFNVDKIIHYSKPAGENGVLNDIAILRLTLSIHESGHIKSAFLPENMEEADKVGVQAHFLGWGRTDVSFSS